MNLRFGVPETGLLAHRTVPAPLAPAELIPGHRRDVDALLAWGRRPSALRVERLGRRWQRGLASKMVCCGRSKGAGIRRHCWWTTWGFTSIPSPWMEQRIAETLTPEQTARAQAIQRMWCEQRLSKLNPPKDCRRRRGRSCWWWTNCRGPSWG